MIGLTNALFTRYRERFSELRSDRDAVAWGGLRFEAALDVLGKDARPEAINALLHAASVHP